MGFVLLFISLFSSMGSAMHSRFSGPYQFLRFNDVMAELEATSNNEKHLKKQLRIEALNHLLEAAQFRDYQAMDYIYLNMANTRALASLIDPIAVSKNRIIMPIEKLMGKGNSFAALLVLEIYMNIDRQVKPCIMAIIMQDKNPIFLHEMAIGFEQKGEL